MSGAGGQHEHVARFDGQRLAAVATDAQARAAARDAERLVDLRMIVHVRKNAVPPHVAAPAVRAEKSFNFFFGVLARAQVAHVFVDERRIRAVRHVAVEIEAEGEGRRHQATRFLGSDDGFHSRRTAVFFSFCSALRRS